MSPPVLPERRRSPARLVGFGLLLAGVAVGLAAFSAAPWRAYPPDAALLQVAFKHVAAFSEAGGGVVSEAELARLPRHMRPQSGQRVRTGTRRDTRVRITLDGRVLLDRVYRPSGVRHDGPTYAYQELPLPLGRHRLVVTVRDAVRGTDESVVDDAGDDAGGAATAGRWRLERAIDIEAGRVLLVELSDDAGLTVR